MRETLAAIEEMKARWMTGGSAGTAAPAGWNGQPDLALLALAGQFTRVAERPVPPAGTAPRPDLPNLALPPLPDEARPLFRRAVEDKELGGDRKLALLTLMAARGFTCHPFDMIPKPQDGLPPVYGPWLDWQEHAPARTADALTAENWDDWTPHARGQELARMLDEDRAAARSLIAALAPQVSADQRVRLFEGMQRGLEPEDADLLEAFVGDRSGKVAEMCSRMLARLGKRGAPEDQLDELLSVVSVETAGVFRKERRIALKSLKTSAQKRRFHETMASVPVPALAGALDLDPIELVRLWPEDDLETLAAPLAATGSDAMVAALIDRMLDASKLTLLDPVLDRLSAADRVALAPRIAAADGLMFAVTAQCLAPAPGCLPHKIIAHAPGMVELEKAIRAEADLRDARIHTALLNLGLIADADAAERLMTVLTTKLHLMAADPRLALLRLNASLKETAP